MAGFVQPVIAIVEIICAACRKVCDKSSRREVCIARRGYGGEVYTVEREHRVVALYHGNEGIGNGGVGVAGWVVIRCIIAVGICWQDDIDIVDGMHAVKNGAN